MLMLVTTVVVAFSSELLVGAIEGVTEKAHMSDHFIGIQCVHVRVFAQKVAQGTEGARHREGGLARVGPWHLLRARSSIVVAALQRLPCTARREPQGLFHGLPKASEGFRGAPRASEGLRGLGRPPEVFQGLPMPFEALQGLPRPSKVCQVLPKSSKAFQGLPRASGVFQERPRPSMVRVQGIQELPRLSFQGRPSAVQCLPNICKVFQGHASHVKVSRSFPSSSTTFHAP